MMILVTIKFPLKQHHWQKQPTIQEVEKEPSKSKFSSFWSTFLYTLMAKQP